MSEAAPYVSSFVLEYAYKRTLGPVLSKFFSGLKAGILLGGRTRDGQVLMPPTEYDPRTGDDLVGMVRVSTVGTITSWTWVSEPGPGHPMEQPFAYGLVRLDGTDSDLLHVILADQDDVVTGARVELSWRPEAERTGTMHDIAGFVLVKVD